MSVPLVDSILITEEAAKSEKVYAITQSVVDFVNDLRDKRHYLDDEMPRAALHVYASDLLLAQVSNGGFSQYVANFELYRLDEKPWLDLTLEALKAMEPPAVNGGLSALLRKRKPDSFVSIFEEMLAILKADVRPDGYPVKNGDDERIEAACEALDDRFYALNEIFKHDRFSAMQRAYILKQPNLRVLPKRNWIKAMIALGEANPLRAERAVAARKMAEEADRAYREAELNDPAVMMAMRLCKGAATTYIRQTSRSTAFLDDQVVGAMSLDSAIGKLVMLWTWDEAFLFPEKGLPPGIGEGLPAEAAMQAVFDAVDAADTSDWGRYRRKDGELARLPIDKRWFSEMPT